MNFEDLSPAEQEEMKETFSLWRKPPEYFDKILIDAPCSGEGIKPPKGISHLLDEYSADEARKRYQS